jgi:sugar phosphate permease
LFTRGETLLDKGKKNRKIFFGWWTVLTGGILSLWAAGYHSYGFSALFKPIASELGFSRAATSVAASIGRLEGGFEGPIAGWITDRFGPRWIILAGVLLTGSSLILMNFIDSLWAFYLIWGVMLGTGHNFASTLPVDKAITNWFVKKRGTALSIKWVLSGLSGVAVLPLVAWLITLYGWRMTCVIGGLVMILVGAPLTWFFIRQHRPEYYGLLPDGTTSEEDVEAEEMIDRGVKYAAEVQEIEFTLRQAMRTPTFWLLILAYAAHAVTGPAINIHLIPFLTDGGVAPLKAAGMMVIMIGASLPSRFVGGILADRVRTNQIRFLLGGAYLLQAVGIAVYLLSPSMTTIYLWFIIYGTGMGAGYAIMAPLRARYFGRKAFGSIQGISMMVTTPVGVIAPVYVGWAYDTTGSYITAFTVIAAVVGLSALIAALVPPPKPPTHITDVRKFL